MKQKISAIASLGIAIVLLAGIFIPAEPVSAGAAVWSAETIPNKLDYILGPDNPGDNLDVRDFSITDDNSTIYAAPGNSITNNVVYKSVDAAATWRAIQVDIQADFVAVAPDDGNIVAIGNSTTGEVYLSLDGGTIWYPLGVPQETGGGAAAAAIYDIAISYVRETKHYIAVAGADTAGQANVWHFDFGVAVPAWKETKTLPGFTNGDEVKALAFSKGFSSDATMVIISEDDGVGVHLQIMDISAQKWNNSAGYANYPCAVISDGGITGLSSASLSLAPGYLATDADSRTLFIGLTVEGNAPAVATSGICRFVDTVKTDLILDIKIHSVAYNGSYLVAGSYDSNVVYRSTNPSSSLPGFLTTTTTKEPGGENKVLLTWFSTSVVAGTSGNESAFSISTDNGQTFNDISLIDTVIANAIDVAVSSAGGKIYLVTNDGNDLSLWRFLSSWRRVFSLPGITNCIVRLPTQNTEVVYLAQRGTTNIYYNSSGGQSTQWHTRTCNINIQDLAVESTTIIYALNNAGSVSKSTSAGTAWGTAIATTLSSGATIVSVTAGTLLVGSQDGYVAYSTNSNLSWTVILQQVDGGAGNVQVVADQYFATNNTIYAASDTPWGNIKKWQIDTSTEWTDIFNNTLNGGIYGLSIDTNILYALEYNTTTDQSTLWLYISPTTATATSTSWSSSTTTATTDIDDNNVRLNAAPQALKTSTSKAWAVKRNGTNKLYSFTNTTVSITLISPSSGFTTPANAFTGVAHDIPFTWERPSESTEYELDIALDTDFNSLITTVTVANINDIASAIVGPRQAGNNAVNFIPGVTYYWRIRTTKPVYSTYSAIRYFSIEPVMATLPGVLTPANGRTNMSRKPAFSWSPVIGATEYQFILSDNIAMTSPVIDVTVTTTGFILTRELEYGGTYFWQVRAIKPVESSWSQLANFTVEKQPTEPVPVLTVEQLEPPLIELPAPTPETRITVLPPLKPPPPTAPDYLRTAIIITSVLLLVVIILIFLPFLVRLLPAPSTLAGPFRGPSRRARNMANELGKVWDDVATRVKDYIPLPTRPSTTGEAREIDTLAFAVRSFVYMTASAEIDDDQRLLSAEEERTLGKKLASGIRAIAGEKPLYLAYPEDAAQFLHIWSHYSSREETNRYLKKSFKSRPENALALLKCFVTASVSPEAGPPEKIEFTQAHYNAIAEVVQPDNVYAAIAKILKFRFEKEEDKTLEDPVDRTIAYQFVRIHYDIKK